MTDASRMVLRAEQDKQQLRSFLRWWNLHLPNDVHVAMTDLCEDIKSGVFSIL
jgi:hypothetical protein